VYSPKLGLKKRRLIADWSVEMMKPDMTSSNGMLAKVYNKKDTTNF
jgi:hypothetical protein